MSNSFKLDVYKRDELGSHGVKNLRREGKVPGIYYSSDDDNNSPFYILDSDLTKAFKSGAHLYQISVGKNLKKVILPSSCLFVLMGRVYLYRSYFQLTQTRQIL